MTKLSTFELMSIFQVSNLRPVYRFFKTNDIFDFETRELKIEPKEAKKAYEQWKRIEKKRREAEMMSKGKMGRPKKQIEKND